MVVSKNRTGPGRRSFDLLIDGFDRFVLKGLVGETLAQIDGYLLSVVIDVEAFKLSGIGLCRSRTVTTEIAGAAALLHCVQCPEHAIFLLPKTATAAEGEETFSYTS